LNSGGGDQGVDAAERREHALDRGAQLLAIPDVGAQPQGGASGLLDLQLGQVELGLAAGQEPDAGAGLGETERQPLSDSPAGPGDQDAFSSNTHSTAVCPAPAGAPAKDRL